MKSNITECDVSELMFKSVIPILIICVICNSQHSSLQKLLVCLLNLCIHP